MIYNQLLNLYEFFLFLLSLTLMLMYCFREKKMSQQTIGQIIEPSRLTQIGMIKKMFWEQHRNIKNWNKELELDIKYKNGEKSYFRNRLKRKRACVFELKDVKNRIDEIIDGVETMLKKKKKRKGRKVYWWYF